jgi:hypothetical protein
MATITITDLQTNRALDYRAMSAIKGAGGAPWVFAFRPFVPASQRVVPMVFNQINLMADQLILQVQNISVENSAPNAQIDINAGQNALGFSLAALLPPLPPLP